MTATYPAGVSGSVNYTGQGIGTSGTITESLNNTTSIPQVVTYTFTASGNGCPVSVRNVAVEVSPTPTLQNLPFSAQICSGDQLNFTPTSDVAGTVFTWTVSAPASITGETNGTGTIDDVLTNTSDAIQTVVYTVTATGPGPSNCVNPLTGAYTVTVYPVVDQTIVNNSPVVCEGEPLSLDYATPTENGDIVLTATYPAGVSGSVNYTGQGIGTSGTITESLDNTTSTPQVVTYTFTASGNGCPVSTRSVDVIVEPRPDVNAVSETICSGEITNVSISNPNGVAGTFFDWVVVNNTNVTGAADGNGALIAQVLTTTDPMVPGSVEYQITPSSNGCNGTPVNVVVTVDPQPLANAGPDAEECDLEHTLNASLSTTGGTGVWSRIAGPGNVVFDDNTSPGTTVTVDQFGTYIFEWLEDNNSCTSTDQVEVRFNEAPQVLSVDDDGAIFCQPSQVNLRGMIGGGATSGAWSLVSGGTGTISASSLTGNVVTATYLTTPGEFGSLVFRLTTNDQDGPGPCTPDSEEVTITINEAPTVTAGGPSLDVCEDAGQITLLGSSGGSANVVTWTGGLGSFSNDNDPTADYIFDASEIGSSVVLTLTTDDPDGPGPCVSVSDQVSVDVNLLPVVDFFDLPQFSNEAAADITVSGNQGGGFFSISPGSGLANPRVEDGLDRVDFQPSSAIVGSNFVTYTFTDAVGCTNAITKEAIVNPVTSIDFTIEGAPSDISDNPIVCANIGRVRLIGFPDAATGNPGTEFTSPVSGLVTQETNGDWVFDTDGLSADTIDIFYTYVNSFDVPTTLMKKVIVQASPVAVISVLNSCVEDQIEFFDNSTVVASTVVDWSWEFGDGMVSSDQNPIHFYSLPNEYTVVLNVESAQGCRASTELGVRVGDTPVPGFVWASICNGDATEFRDESDPGLISQIESFTWDFGDGETISGNANDAIPVGTHGGRTTGIFGDPFHEYADVGNYDVTLTVQTNDGCINSITQTVFILPFNTITPSAQDAYRENFEAGAGGWVATSGVIGVMNDQPVFSDTSWVRGVPSGSTITNPGNNVWWTGRNVGVYFPDEDSYVNGPCFDLSQLTRPMISMDIWVDTQEGFDGAVLQFSTDGGLEWNNLGDLNGGLEWYNSEGLISRPGDSPGNFNLGGRGWSGQTNGWVSARFSLEEIPTMERNFVRFRVAFASDANNPSGTNFNGFAFDNIFIGNKTRTVLLEHFTDNGLEASVDANNYLTDMAQGQLVNAEEVDFTTIQYHVDFTGSDRFNLDNPNDPSGRVTFYGVSQPPVTVMDGSRFNGLTFGLFEVDVDRRSLEDPLFDITIDTLSSPADQLSVDVTLTSHVDLDRQVALHVAVVEDNINLDGRIYRNVLKRLLFGAEGETIDITWTPGTSQRLGAQWTIDTEIYDMSNLYVVAFVQDKVSREVYAASIAKAPNKTRSTITSIDRELAGQVRNISLYPNPANKVLHFAIDSSPLERYDWKIVDQRGVTMMDGTLDFNSDGIYRVETTGMTNGVYYVVVGLEGKALMYRKLAIMNRE